MTVQQRPHVKYGAGAFDPATDELPSVFPREMGPNAMRYLQEVVDSGLSSDMRERMQRRLAEMHGVRFCTGTPGCTQAIYAAMMAMEFEPGDEVIVSPIADYGTVAGVLIEGYVPIFADTEPGSPLVSAETIRPHITDRTRAILVVQKLGLPCDMDPIVDLAREHGLIVIEDCCQAILSTYKGRLTGTLGDVACFSFDAEKTCGADIGGAVLTDNEAIHERVQYYGPSRGAHMVAGFGRVHDRRGFAIQIPQCTAATVLAQLEILPRQVRQRQETAALLDARLAEIPGVVPFAVPPERTHTYWMYGFSLQREAFGCTPDEFAAQLNEAGAPNVGLGRYYLMPEAVTVMNAHAEQGRWPFTSPPASRVPHYSADMTPNARDFLATWVRWFWTEKYNASHVEHMAELVRTVAEKNRV